jgi:hypothetical protein
MRHDMIGSAGVPVAQMLRDLPPADVRVASLIKAYESGDQQVAVGDVENIISRAAGKHVSFSLAGMELSGIVKSKMEDQNGVSMAVRLDDELGVFTLRMRPGGHVFSTLFFEGESHSFSFHGHPEDGRWTMALKSVDHVLCAPLGASFPPKPSVVGMLRAKSRDKKSRTTRKVVGAPPDLDSNPESPFVIYIDLDGEVVDQPEWTELSNEGQPINALPHPRADDVDFVTRVWERVSEDFAPFDINVTTSRTVFDSASPGRRMMCIATPTDDAMPGSGGVAYLNSFGSGLVCWAFNLDEGSLADTVSHEVGHTLGLNHDGKINVFDYYGGHGTGEVSWAPIMGAYFADFEPPFVDEELTQWSKGEYPDATNTEDDLAIITSRNGFGFRNDDHGNDIKTASTLKVADGNIMQNGIIERNTDQDWFSFATSGGNVTINADTTNIGSPDMPTRGSNLALSLTLYDAKGNQLVSENPATTQGAQLSRSLNAGTYYMTIQGEGRGDLVTGFSDYASIGNYFLTGNIPQQGLVTIDPPEADLPRLGGTASFRIITAKPWSWTVDATWVTSDSPKSGTRNGEVSYRVSRNPSREPRQARFIVTSGGMESYHTVRQAGSESDDHGDTFRDATTVAQVSSTPGVLEEPLDIDMFLIEVEGFGDLTVRTTGTTDTYAEFYDVSGARLASDDDGARPNFTITQRVSTGTYFVGVRHSVRGGVGPYTLECSFKSRPALLIDPSKRRAGPSGGRFLINVISNTDWTWSSDVPWIKSTASSTQSRGQSLAYTVDPHNGNSARKGQIVFRNKGNRVVHTVTQRPANDDDHSDKPATATELASNGRQKGMIQFEGDADMFRIRLATSGSLDIKSTGNTDTVGELLDDKGNRLLIVDDRDSDNFHIQQALGAGTYFLRVTTYGGVQIGSYGIESRFTPSRLVDVHYTAGKGGNVRGTAKQSVPLGGDSKSVTAVPKRGYSFVKWSDGVRRARRADLNLLTHLQVTAEFVGTVQVSTKRGKLANKQMPPVDFGTVGLKKSKSMEFTIRNQGSTPLTNLRVESAGFAPRNWRVSKPSRTTIQPGQKATFRIALRGGTPGFYSTQWAIRASGLSRNFIVRTMGVVQVGSFSPSVASGSATSLPAAGQIPGAALSLPWIDVSPDGYFRYRFERPVNDATEQVFRISSDGVSWEEALVLDVWKTHASPGINHFEAVFAPPLVPAPRILVNETSP